MTAYTRLPSVVTATRIVALPVLWLLAAQGRTRTLAIVLAVVAATDVADGILARRLDVRSDLGSRLDSVADHLLSASIVAWLIWLQPGFVAGNAPVLIGWLAFAAVTLMVGWFRFRRIGALHLYSAKAAMVLGYLFVILLFYNDSYDPRFFYLVVVVCYAAVGETLLWYLTSDELRRSAGSLLLRRSRR